MQRIRFKKSLLVGSFMFLSACSTSPYDMNEPDPASVRLAQVAESIQKHDNNLADIEMARYMETSGNKVTRIDTTYIPSVEKVISLGTAWNGPIEPLFEKVSVLAGLNKPRYLGVKPSSDVIVNVNTDYRRIIDILHDAGTQAGSRARVTLKVKEKVLEVEYIPY